MTKACQQLIVIGVQASETLASIGISADLFEECAALVAYCNGWMDASCHSCRTSTRASHDARALPRLGGRKTQGNHTSSVAIGALLVCSAICLLGSKLVCLGRVPSRKWTIE
mmetsp:Transcript_9498/g.13567  ORF Transcript_9498/g.13567 Transcript_9498/m.13567 type:complete len:112 (-) Transcript_9498:109-444(-)|eukprot:scaffold97832_cov27-Tisochrysis_lutea.AAC.1